MLNKVGSALVRFISPISTATAHKPQGETSKDEHHQPKQDAEIIQLDDHRPKSDPAANPESTAQEGLESSGLPAPHAHVGSVSSAFLSLLDRIKGQKDSLSRWLGKKTYSSSKSGKKALRYRKGSMMDEKAE